MTPRNTSTGAVLEAMILPALTRGGYSAEKQKVIGTRCGGGKHKVDAIATRGDERILVSLKWQQTGGTAEQKVPFEVMCLADAVTAGHAVRASSYLAATAGSSATTSRPASSPTI
jgi:PD-(D/E)XK nuclease superfamily protein